MRLTTILIFLFFIFTPAVVFADITGKELLKYCQAFSDSKKGIAYNNTTQQAMDAGECLGYVAGINAMHFYMAVKEANSPDIKKIKKYYIYCLPDKTSNNLIELLIEYLNNHPEKLGEEAYTLFLKAYIYYFPCKNNN